ncbi:MAG: FAD-binding oxidoreductase, partial [Dehalococcoidia bacterium]
MAKSARSQVDVVVIGAGIVGCSTAYYLSKRGAKVALIEKGEVAGEQSSRAWGWVRQQGRNPREIPLSIFSKGLWSELSSEINADVEWIEDGSLKLAYTEEEMAKFESWAKEARDLGLDTQVMSASEVKELITSLEGSFLGGVYTPSDGQAEPGKGTEAMARAAKESGTDLYSHRSVQGFRVEGGTIKEVLTDQGGIEADSVVCAAGAWSSKLGRMVGVNLPQRVVKGTVVCTEPSEIVSHITVMSPDVTFRQKRDGTFYISNGVRSDYYVNRDSFRDI